LYEAILYKIRVLYSRHLYILLLKVTFCNVLVKYFIMYYFGTISRNLVISEAARGYGSKNQMESCSMSRCRISGVKENISLFKL
jgi:hypothetical protein